MLSKYVLYLPVIFGQFYNYELFPYGPLLSDFCSENASIPYISWGNYVIVLDMQLGRLHMVLCNAIIFLSSFFLHGTEYGTM